MSDSVLNVKANLANSHDTTMERKMDYENENGIGAAPDQETGLVSTTSPRSQEEFFPPLTKTSIPGSQVLNEQNKVNEKNKQNYPNPQTQKVFKVGNQQPIKQKNNQHELEGFFDRTYAAPENPLKILQLHPRSEHTFRTSDDYEILHSIRQNCGDIDPSKIWREGNSLIINPPTIEFAGKVNNIGKIADIPVQKELTASHRDLNSIRGVVDGSRLMADGTRLIDKSEEQLNKGFKNSIKKHRISEVTRLGNSNKLLLKFQCGSLPLETYYGIQILRVVPYKRLPRRCYRCHNYGHSGKKCRLEATTVICSNCGLTKEKHRSTNSPNRDNIGSAMGDSCLLEPRCIPCKIAGHNAKSSLCPRYILEKAIIKMIDSEKISPEAARIRCARSNEAGVSTYAESAKRQLVPAHRTIIPSTKTFSNVRRNNNNKKPLNPYYPCGVPTPQRPRVVNTGSEDEQITSEQANLQIDHDTVQSSNKFAALQSLCEGNVVPVDSSKTAGGNDNTFTYKRKRRNSPKSNTKSSPTIESPKNKKAAKDITNLELPPSVEGILPPSTTCQALSPSSAKVLIGSIPPKIAEIRSEPRNSVVGTPTQHFPLNVSPVRNFFPPDLSSSQEDVISLKMIFVAEDGVSQHSLRSPTSPTKNIDSNTLESCQTGADRNDFDISPSGGWCAQSLPETYSRESFSVSESLPVVDTGRPTPVSSCLSLLDSASSSQGLESKIPISGSTSQPVVINSSLSLAARASFSGATGGRPRAPFCGTKFRLPLPSKPSISRSKSLVSYVDEGDFSDCSLSLNEFPAMQGRPIEVVSSNSIPSDTEDLNLRRIKSGKKPKKKESTMSVRNSTGNFLKTHKKKSSWRY